MRVYMRVYVRLCVEREHEKIYRTHASRTYDTALVAERRAGGLYLRPPGSALPSNPHRFISFVR
jgi:hypothetical protein